METVKCKICGIKYHLEISSNSFRKNGKCFYSIDADRHNGRPWNTFRCQCGRVIEDNYEPTAGKE
jgi:hypothetical protein